MIYFLNNHKPVFRIIPVLLVIVALLASSTEPALAKSTKKPTVTAAGAIVYCENTGETIFSKNGNKTYNPYSITKLMTALLVVQNLPLDKKVTVSAEAAAQGESSMNLVEGEKVTVEQLLYGALLKSGNDAAYALGEAVSGNMTDFVKLMNKTAKNIGCKHTHFANPNGLEDSKHYTTAQDFMQITRVALSNDTIKKIAGTETYKMEKTNKHKARTMKNTLPLLKDKDSGIYAGKSGLWTIYDCSIAVGYEKNGLQLCIVLLGDTKAERTKDVKKLIEYAESTIEGVKVVKTGKEAGKVRIRHGAKTRLQTYTSETGYAYLPKEGSESLIRTEVVMDSDVTAPVKKGQVVGHYNIYVGNDVVNKVPLVVKESVEEGWIPSYVGISNRATVIIAVVLVLLAGFFLWASAMRAQARKKQAAMRRRKIMRMAAAELEKEEEQRKREQGW